MPSARLAQIEYIIMNLDGKFHLNELLHSVCEITASQRTFSGQKRCLSGHTDICMDKMSGRQTKNQMKIDNYICNYKNFNTMSRQFYPCPCKIYHALTECQPIFQKLLPPLVQGLM